MTAAAEAAVWADWAADDMEHRIAAETAAAAFCDAHLGDCADTQAPPAEEPTDG
jgi:hypothetical protein